MEKEIPSNELTTREGYMDAGTVADPHQVHQLFSPSTNCRNTEDSSPVRMEEGRSRSGSNGLIHSWKLFPPENDPTEAETSHHVQEKQ